MGLSDSAECEKLCLQKTANASILDDLGDSTSMSFYCCYLNDGEGCYWSSDSVSVIGSNVNGIAVTCRLGRNYTFYL